MQGNHHELSRKISHAGKIVRELQDLSMGMRMIPLRGTFQKMARLVRDVAQKCGKQVEFITEGEDTEIDRNMVDLIADPLVHMVRNAVDHGIERPDKRESAGKSGAGKIRLAAYHAGGDVVVELSDDGAGLDRDVIVAKAIAKNLIETDKGLSESEIFNLIFAPGFSTAVEVTDVSGRGVGMDVVRRNIEAMRGRVTIASEKGKGSVFTVRLPLTLAITDGMLIRVGSERFIIPIVNIHLSFQPTPAMLSSVTGRGELVSLRGELMPVFRLHRLFKVSDAIEDPTNGLLMIVGDGRRR
jgi:two-component system chemotaxis sensor kinase CheA